MSDEEVAQYLHDNRKRLLTRSRGLKYYFPWISGAYHAVICVLLNKTNPNRVYNNE